MKLEIEVPDSWLARFNSVRIPEELCGPSIEERITYLIGEALDGFEALEARGEQHRLYRLFGMRSETDLDDDIDL